MVNLSQIKAQEWSRIIDDAGGGAEIDVEKSMTDLTFDIIAHTQFGSSYEKGKHVFRLMGEIRGIIFKYIFLLLIPKAK